MRLFGSVVLLGGVVLVGVACTSTTTTTAGEPGSSSGGATPPSSGGGGGGGTGGGSGAKDGGASGGTICERVCDKAAAANCPAQSTCVKDCEADLGKIPASCKEQADAANECAAERATSWKCSSKGRPQVDAGCDKESEALVSCVLGGGGGGGTDGGGGGSCGNLSSGNAQCDTCVNSKCCAEATACSNDPACTDILGCFSTKNCADDACYTQCENAHPTGVQKEQAFYGCLGSSCKTACQ
jgi:hypothetical protein